MLTLTRTETVRLADAFELGFESQTDF
jgi:hypothetical protein